MKCMIIGSCSPEAENFHEFKESCREIAEALVEKKVTLMISSLFDDSADYWVYKAFSRKSTDIEIHYLDIADVRSRIQEECVHRKVALIPYLNDSTELDLRYAYLFCQLNALKETDVIITVGGKNTGSATLLLSLADASKIIIPIIGYEGAAKAYYDKYRYKLSDRLSGQISLITTGSPKEIIDAFIDDNTIESTSTVTADKVFISYARDNSQWADMTEVFLRRRSINLFRDESDFTPGAPIQEYIMKELHSCNVFIALWCKEYACSPWCFDELEEALDLAQNGKMSIWILCVDNTRIVPKRARSLHHYTIKSRDELEGKLLQLLEGKN